MGVSFTILEVVFAFVPGPGNSAAAIDGLLLTYALGTAFGLAVGFVAMMGYPLTKQKHEEIHRQLATRTG